jgi:hypothetical protein
MDSRSRAAFGLLILAQAAHSVEEYAFRLFDVVGPARFISRLFSDNIARGFAVANTGIVLVGVWCYVARVRTPHPRERTYAWFWTCFELGNGVGHLVLSGVRGGYLPGAGTAPLLIAASSYLGARLMKRGRPS